MRPSGRGEAPVRVAGVDFGERWLGISLSDPSGRIAHPLERAAGKEEALKRLAQLISKEEVALIVVGLPRNMDGSLGPKAREVILFADLLRQRFPVPVETWDERLTTVQAERSLEAAGMPRRKWKQRVNQVAAQILLQSFLDARCPPAGGAGEGPASSSPPRPDPGGTGDDGEA